MMIKTPVQHQLEQPEVQEAITSFLQNLPIYQQQLEFLGQLTNFGQAVFSDKQGLQQYDQMLQTYNLNMETIEALIGLLEKLPRLNQMLEQLENVVAFVMSILGDETTLANVTESIKEYTKPIVEKGQAGLSLTQAIQQEAESNKEPITLLMMYKWLKDPTVQQSLKYVQATLTILSKNKS
ncbi:hypothetical protein [Lysinibacillus sp. LZ02]|uniref:hypothetical protein n=1 Tax=Lysinibacillus sp. LZ02 TaxID=3420668 RepID=UPI003D361256